MAPAFYLSLVIFLILLSALSVGITLSQPWLVIGSVGLWALALVAIERLVRVMD